MPQKAQPKRRRGPTRKARPAPARSPDNNRLDEAGLEPNEASFVREYLREFPRNQTRAYMRAYGIGSKGGYDGAAVSAARLMAKAAVREAVEAAEFRLAKDAEIEARSVIARLLRNISRAEEKADLGEVRKGVELLGRWRGLALWRDTVAHTGENGGPVNVRNLTKLSVEELRELDALESQREAILGGAQGRP